MYPSTNMWLAATGIFLMLCSFIKVLLNGIRVLEEMKADEVLQDWIGQVYVGTWLLGSYEESVSFLLVQA